MKIDLHEFIAKREKLARICSKLAISLDSLDTAIVTGGVVVSGPAALSDLIAKLRSTVFRILVAGEFNAGKSFFLNTLLDRWSSSTDAATGKPITSGLLGVDIVPATAIITELRYSKHESAELILRKGGAVALVLEDLASFTDLARFARNSTAHLHAGGVFQSLADELRVPLEQLGNACSERPDAVSRWIYNTFERAVVYLPSHLLEDGITLVDSPGLGAVHEEHERITESEMRRSDAVLFLIDSASPLTDRAMNFLLSARAFVDNFFFVQTKTDRLGNNSIDIERARKYNLSRIAELLGCAPAETRYHSVSARLYRDGIACGDQNKCESSRMVDLVADLSKFLVSSRGSTTLNREMEVTNQLIKQGIASCAERLKRSYATAAELDLLLAEARSAVESLGRLQFEVRSLVNIANGKSHSILRDRQSGLRDKMQGAREKMVRWREIAGSQDRALTYSLKRIANDFTFEEFFPDVDAATARLRDELAPKLAMIDLALNFARIRASAVEPNVSSSWWERLIGGAEYEAQIEDYRRRFSDNLANSIDEHFVKLQSYLDDGFATMQKQLMGRVDSIEMSRGNADLRLDAERKILEEKRHILSQLVTQVEALGDDAATISGIV